MPDSAVAAQCRLVSQLARAEPEMMDVLRQFVTGLPDRVREMRAAFERQDFALLRMLAHRLKGAGGSYGYPIISALAAEMEQRFNACDATCFLSDAAALERLAAAAEAGLAAPPVTT